jgi:hypothetical protein
MISSLKELTEIEELWLANELLEGINPDFIKKYSETLKKRKQQNIPEIDDGYYNFTINIHAATIEELDKIVSYLRAIGTMTYGHYGTNPGKIIHGSYFNFRVKKFVFGEDTTRENVSSRISGKIISYLDSQRIYGYSIS